MKRSVECILDNTIELLSPQDATDYLTRKLLELGISIPKVTEQQSEPLPSAIIEEAKEDVVVFSSGWT